MMRASLAAPDGADRRPVPGAEPAGPTAIDRLLAAYAIASGLALAFPNRPESWPWLVALHVAVVILALRLGPVRALWTRLSVRAPRISAGLHALYPLLLLPALYLELATLNVAVHGGRYFDDAIIALEGWVFGGQPSASLAEALPLLPLSELLHGAYLSYYPLIYGPPAVLLASGRLRECRDAVFALMLTFVVHYLFFVYLPVQGPRYLFPAPGGEIAGGALYGLAHTVLEAGSSRGAAFPSSHVAVAVAQSVVVRRYLPRLFPIVAALSIGLAVGAVYGGFHYAIDAVVGAVLGLTLALAAPRVQDWIDARA